MPKLFDFQEQLIQKHIPVSFTLIGDDMGLGKTVEAIEIDKGKRKLFAREFITKHKGKPLTLVVAPLSVTGSWARHYKVWAPELKVYVIDTKNRDAFLDSVMRGTHDVYVCHWQTLWLIPELQNILWFHVIADEVHRAKNRKAQQTVALKKLWTEHKTGASGTPADNRPDDFWSILNWLYPRKFSSYHRFRNHHLIIKRHNTDDGSGEGCRACDGWHRRAFDEIMGCAHTDELMAEIEPFYTRRLKEAVLSELPEKYYTTVEVDLGPPQRRAYEDMRKTMLAWVGKHENEPIAAPIVVAQLTRLQQFACAYAQIEWVTKRYRNCKDEACVVANTCLGHKVSVVRLHDPSTKLDAVMDIIEDNPDKQIGVFSQSKQMAYMLNARLKKRKITTAILTGDVTKQSDRDELVERFQQGERQIFIGTIAAGGEGITLTAASTGIFIDRAWSPSKNKQAEDRFHRIGQKNAVQIIDIVAKNTIDAGRNQKINLKWSWIKEILGDNPPAQEVWDTIKMYDDMIGR